MYIAIKRADGAVSIMETDDTINIEESINKWKESAQEMQYVSHRIIDKDKIPTDRCFRDAWTDDNPTDTIDIDMSKAKTIKLNEFRALRRPLLEKLDVAYLQADEAGETQLKQEIAAKKQELRDVTEISLPDTVEELKNFLPDVLK